MISKNKTKSIHTHYTNNLKDDNYFSLVFGIIGGVCGILALLAVIAFVAYRYRKLYLATR